jgi:protein-S-isoprenylcysteine O-methyltransferase Ste14
MTVAEFLPEISFGWRCAWWYVAVFVLVNLAFVLPRGSRTGRRLIALPRFESRKEKLLSLASVGLFGRGMMIYSVFITIKLDTVWFYPGTAIYVAGLGIYTAALASFTSTPLDQPVVTGVYRFSRHPMQLSAVIMWLGVALATLSWVVAVACLFQCLRFKPFLKAQERACREQYGYAYREYEDRVPRFLGRGASPA